MKPHMSAYKKETHLDDDDPDRRPRARPHSTPRSTLAIERVDETRRDFVARGASRSHRDVARETRETATTTNRIGFEINQNQS